MINNDKRKIQEGQVAIEYLLILMVVAIIVFIAFRKFLPNIQQASNVEFRRITNGIMGEPPPDF